MKALADFADAHLRIFDRPTVPHRVRTAYLIGICGTGMGALAGLLQQSGISVSGSDAGVYPPMSTILAELGIRVHDGFDAAHLDPAPDLVVVGNACPPTHVEAAAAREQGLPQLSLPEAVSHFFSSRRRSLVVAGTHGKTTTAGLLVHLLREGGRDPGYLVGGILQNLGASYALGSGSHFVIEGDEYDSAYFDKQPKFMHYGPDVAIVTSMEFDHADIYDSWEEYQEAFNRFTTLVPVEGCLAVCGDHPVLRQLETEAPIVSYGLGPDCDVTAARLQTGESGVRFRLVIDGEDRGPMHLPMSGNHNVRNALGATAVAVHEGLTPEEIRRGLGTFKGVKRRQEILGTHGDIVVVDDFAHHPTAVRATIQAACSRWPGRRVLAVFEPRSNSSRRRVFESAYSEAFDEAALAYLSTPPFRHNDDRSQFMDIGRVVAAIRSRGTEAHAFSDVDSLRDRLMEQARPGDVILIMSNGGFGGLHGQLLQCLEQRFSDEY